MGALVGLGVGVGLLLVWSSFQPPVVRPGRRQARLPDLLGRAGLDGIAVRTVVAASAVCAVTAGLAVLATAGAWPVSLVFALIGGYLPFAALQGRARRRQRDVAEVWPEAVDNLASAVRAGMSLPEALGALGTRGPAALRPAFAAFALDYQVSGRFPDALDRLKDRLADPVGDRVVEALRIAREVGGGDLGRLLRNLSSFLRQDARTRSELESRQAWTVSGARLAVAAPWLVLLMLSFQPDVIARYSSPGGAVVIFGGAACCLVAYRLMIRIGRLPSERRVLA
ncbi:type II secretion system F family protein [Nocardioides jiangxiensis]|uniref:Type II secretion system F family protein n=1 Tax=Nocardioides jiangxiensis TaxID=3064524 RepID=A0ABT9B2G7_9ACTN|nr:type II secretion system F family protein [Nocardioides sp. WY-20]MDO7868960.1 type II secretion system F family protein [Nocardioides sp. WY-20]